MSVVCIVSGHVKDVNGANAAGAVIEIERCVVANARSVTYEVRAIVDSSGNFSFTVPQGARLRFASSDVSAINGWNFTVPNTVAANLGVFKVDIATEVGARNATGAGTPAARTVLATEYGTAGMRQTLLRLAKHPVTVGNSSGVSFGGALIYTFPEGRIHVLGCTRKPVTVDLSDEGNVTPVDAADGGDFALGTTAPDDGTMTGTDVDINPSTSIDPLSGGAAGAVLAAAAIFDGTTTPIPVYANLLIDDADVGDGASDIILLDCVQILLTWCNLGDTA